jgi:branched-chain amino acid transport system substrate-binding protein
MKNISRRGVLGGMATAGALSAFPAILTRPVRAQEGPIRIAVVCPLSGAFQPVGAPVLLGAQIAADQINAAGGVGGRMIELIVRDDKGDPTQSVAAARELTSNGVNLIVGIPLTHTALAVAGVIESIDGVYISTGTLEEKLTHELFTRHYFAGTENGITRAYGQAHVIAERYPDVTTWVGVVPDVSIGHGSYARISKALKSAYKELHGKEVETLDPVVAKLASTDFKNQIVNLLSSPATGLHNVLFGNDGITFFQQAAQFQLPQKFTVVSEQAIDIDLPKTLKGGIPENIWSNSYWYHGAFADQPESVALAKAIFDKTGDANPHAFSSLSHNGVKAYAKAIETAGGKTDSGTVIDAMENLKMPSAKGEMYFRKEDHQIIASGSAFNAQASSSNPQGWEIKNFAKVDLGKITNPPAPGEVFTF